MTDELEFLCTADVHLGRHPSRVPAGLDGPELSPRAVWSASVQRAIDRGVDAVVVAGDIVDQENRYFEAYGTFEDGVTRLDEHGIPVVFVAGNHDADSLPEMAANLNADAARFLGGGGEWERWTLERDGAPLAHFDGWSFPQARVHESPLDTYDPPDAGGTPVIGVLHADLDAPGSRYAPVQASELRETTAAAWVLGHIHTPAIRIDARPLTLYPGSPQPLDPGERRAHGPWLLTIPSEGAPSAEQLPLATVRYDRIAVDATDAQSTQSVTSLISEALDEHVRAELDGSAVELSLARVELTGRTPAHSDLVDGHRDIVRDLGFREGTTSVRLESIEVDTRPAVDLEAIADGDNAAAYLARVLLELEHEEGAGDAYGDVLGDALEAMRRVHGANPYSPLRRETGLAEPDREEAAETLEQQARLLLDTLLEQKRGEA